MHSKQNRCPHLVSVGSLRQLRHIEHSKRGSITDSIFFFSTATTINIYFYNDVIFIILNLSRNYFIVIKILFNIVRNAEFMVFSVTERFSNSSNTVDFENLKNIFLNAENLNGKKM